MLVSLRKAAVISVVEFGGAVEGCNFLVVKHGFKVLGFRALGMRSSSLHFRALA